MEKSQVAGYGGGGAIGSKGTNPSSEEEEPITADEQVGINVEDSYLIEPVTDVEHNSWVGINIADPYLIDPEISANGSLGVRQELGEHIFLKEKQGEVTWGVGEKNE